MTIEIFPFRELDDDVQQYGHWLYVYLNNQLPKLKALLDKYKKEHMEAVEKIRLEELVNENEEKKSPTIILDRTDGDTSKLKLCIFP